MRRVAGITTTHITTTTTTKEGPLGERAKWQYEAVELTEQSEPTMGAVFPVPWKEIGTVKAFLNQMGAEGWELVSALPEADIQGCTRKVALFFKRPA